MARGALILLLWIRLRGFANFHQWKMQHIVAFFFSLLEVAIYAQFFLPCKQDR